MMEVIPVFIRFTVALPVVAIANRVSTVSGDP